MKFNHKFTNQKHFLCNGENMTIRNILDMPQFNGDKINFCQCIECGYRMGKDDMDYSKWNGTIWEDIDYKKCIDIYKIEPLKIYNDVWNYLLENYNSISYYSDLSRSGKGFHFMFYFNVNKNKNNWFMCKSMSICIIREAFIKCGYGDIINYELGRDKVHDDCTNTVYQMIYITKCKYNINECSGDCKDIIYKNYSDYSLQYDKLTSKLKIKENKNNQTSKNYNTENINTYKNYDCNIILDEKYEMYMNDEMCEYIPHSSRYLLFMSLSKLCGENDDLLKKLWTYCANKIPEMNGHTTQYYVNAPYNMDWNKNRFIKENEFNVSTYLLKEFNIRYKYVNKKQNKPLTKTRVIKIDENI